jgi:hypothetical protein
LAYDPKLRFGEEIFQSELGGPADRDFVFDALQDEIGFVPGFSVDAGNLF